MNFQILKLTQKLIKPWKLFLSPDDLNQVEECSIPRTFQRKFEEKRSSDIKISFLGDITNTVSEKMTIGDQLKHDLTKSDYIIVNLESLPVKDSSFSVNAINRNYISKNKLKEFVESFPKQKVVFGLANNHAFDYGAEGLKKTKKIIEEIGAEYIGTSEKPFMYLGDKLRIDAHTLWDSSEKTEISNLDSNPSLAEDDEVIKFLHWGEEFEDMPSDSQVEQAENLKKPIVICGHHGHCPQPIQYLDQTLCAYSLGDFISQNNTNAPERGMHLQVEFTKLKQWEIRSSEWNFISQHKETVENCI